MNLKIKSRTVMRKENFGGLCYFKDLNIMLALDDPAFFVIENIQKGKDLEEIISSHAEVFKISTKQSKQEIEDLLKELKNRGIINGA